MHGRLFAGPSCNELMATGCSTEGLTDAGCSVETCEPPAAVLVIEGCGMQLKTSSVPATVRGA